MKKTSSNIKILSTFIILFLTAINGFAQNTNEEKYYTNINKQWLAEIPLWVPGFRGQLVYGNYNLYSSGDKEEKDYEKLQSKLGIEFYFVGRLAAKHNNFWFQLDAFSGKISSAFSYTSLIGNNEKKFVDISVQGTIPRMVSGYSVWKTSFKNNFELEITPYVGVRYINIYLKSDVFDLTNVINVKPNWFEAVLGVYLPIDYKRFRIEFQGDYGFGESKNSYNLSNRYKYRISDLIDVQLGLNYLQINHEDTILQKKLVSTIKLFGPTAGVGFWF